MGEQPAIAGETGEQVLYGHGSERNCFHAASWLLRGSPRHIDARRDCSSGAR
ncbi:MAG: hypothetical protein OXH15_02480 [Gammaproteobacteria bacterium]|nr:hypothetical protein [Gammaproteobacteria bacterium]